MRFGVDGCRIHGTTGVARYIVNVVEGWSSGRAAGPREGITIFTPRSIDRSKVALREPVKERVVPASHERQLIWQNTALARACDTDVLWCPAYVAPLRCRAKIVVTTHDATNAMHPSLYSYGDRVFYRHFYGWCARRATLVITNNDQTQADIEKHYGVPRERIRVVPLAPARIFRRVDDAEAVGATRIRLLGDDRPYFLSVGKISVRRNVPLVIEGFARFREKTKCPHRMVIVGRNGLAASIRRVAADLGVSEHLTHIEYVTDEELLHLYNGTEGFVTAATYEANSFTTVEAQATGAPVVIPDVPGMRQTTAGIAVIMPRVGVNEISDAMARLATDDDLRLRLSEEGRRFASSFSWERTSQGILSVLEEAASTSCPTVV